MAENRRSCADCGTPNEEDSRFCEGCGGALARKCTACGVESRATARFCRGCGAPLDGQVATDSELPAAGPARKTVTVMFADLVGSTSFEENVDAETAREVIGRYHDLLRSTAERHRAGVTKYIGDGFMAVWGVPEIGPDDAARAVDAAVELQERFVDVATEIAKTHSAQLTLRVAVNTGEVVVGTGDADLVGDALNVGARLEAECPRGHVVVGEETWRATRTRYGYESLGQVQVKGRNAPVAVYQWLGRQSEAAAPFVGRSGEVRRLQAVLDDAIATRVARLVTVIGDPGVGKSRLATEFTAAHGDICVIEARCAAERTVALGPIVELLRARDLETDVPPGVPERDRLLRDLNGLTEGVAGSVEEYFWALRRYIEVLAADVPVLLVLDDIQWAGTLLLDFIEHLMEWVQDVPVLVLALARPELREIRPDFVIVSRWVSEAVPLSGLDAQATAELAANVLGAGQLPDELLRRLPSSTGGNPLFVRELVGMLAHDGVLVEQPSGWRLTIDVDAIAIPPTIHALLASRLERLDGTDRRVLEIASVVGTDFSVGTIRALADAGAEGVKRSLDRLRRLELAQPSGTYVGDEPVWRFHHVLIRDVAYRRLLKSDRADLHERLADWVASGGASVAFDNDELIARHLDAAHTYRLELGNADEHTGDLALRAARHYAASARRALDRDELVSAGTQAARASALANADPAVHAELLVTGCEAFLSAGDVAAGAPLVDELERIADDALQPWAACYRCQFIVYTAPERLLEVDSRLQGAIDEFSRRTDPTGLAKAHRVRASARFRLGRVGDAEVDLFEALIAARQSGDHRQITAALGAAPGAALWGPSPVPKAGGRCLDVVRMQRMTTAAPSLEATSMRHLAVLELLRGRPDKARTMLADARQIVADLGLRHGLMETELFAGIIESMEGDPVAAEPHFRTALEGLDALGVGADAGQAAALLAKSVLAQGRIDEADGYAAESERLAGRNLKTAIAWRAVRAEILAAHGRHGEAAAMAREAVSVAASTDLVLDHAEACLAMSRVHAAAGDAPGARSARSEAEMLYAAKEVANTIAQGAEPVSVPPSVEAPPTASRLAVVNEACRILAVYDEALNAGAVEATVRCYADQFVYDDRRRMSGDPVRGRGAIRAAIARLLEQYTHFEFRVLAVRGRNVALLRSRSSDDHGNETVTLGVVETDDHGLLVYLGRFEEDDFEGALCELQRRYYEGEGAANAETGALSTAILVALNRGEYDRVFGELSAPDMHIENRSSSFVPDRSTNELRTSWSELSALVSSSRTWPSAVYWLNPQLYVARIEREALGHDDEHYSWAFLLVGEAKDGRAALMCQFDLDDEAAAFAYAEERMRSTTSRLAVTNRSSETLLAFTTAIETHDVDLALELYSDRLVCEYHGSLGGEPITDLDAMRNAIQLVFEQFNHLETRTLAVRGERSHLYWSRISDEHGNQSSYLFVNEVDERGRIIYQGGFDDADFESAYRELERRYYAGEGAAFAEEGARGTDWITLLNQGDYDRLFRELAAPDVRLENRSTSALGSQSIPELRSSLQELDAMVASRQSWHSALHWLSPHWVIVRFEREAVGFDGEQYGWSWLDVYEIRGRFMSACRFDVEDEVAALAYAEERMRATDSRLAVSNQSCNFMPPFVAALRVGDAEGVVNAFADGFVYDDRRRLSGDPIVGHEAMRAAVRRIFEQYNQFEFRVLAVRGDRLNLLWSRWADDNGNETTTLYVNETDDEGRVYYHARFDEEDFVGAYRELERRYYAAEGAAFAAGGAVGTEWVIALNEGHFDLVFEELTMSDMRVENRSLSLFGDRSADELRATFEDLNDTVTVSHTWISAVVWLSPECVVTRFEREAIGHDGEIYTWTRIHVAEVRDGRIASSCRFEIDDEESAFAYANERVQAATRRLAVTNRASDVVIPFFNALNAHDANGALETVSEQFVFDDHRRLSGDAVVGRDAMRVAIGRVLEQYTHFESRVLAVRGERVTMVWSRFSDDDGNETVNLNVAEIDDDALGYYLGRFDEDDFEGAYRELERRYYAGEGAAFAEGGVLSTATVVALNRGDYDRVVTELCVPDMQIENRSRSAFPDRSANDLRASWEELDAMVSSSRTWFSVVHWVSPRWTISRLDRDAVGHHGESYAWAFLLVAEVKDGRSGSMCQFNLEDEDAAFAYADEQMRATTSRLAVTNRSCEFLPAFFAALRAHDVDRLFGYFSDQLVYVDRRRLSGDPVIGLEALRRAAVRVFGDYTRFEYHVLAVRGDRLHLLLSRWSDDGGNESTHLHVEEWSDDGFLEFWGRFDEEDFEGAYRELERRYYEGEGTEFAEVGALSTSVVVAVNKGDYDRVLGELVTADLRMENRSSSALPDLSASDLLNSWNALDAMVASSRTWFSVVHLLSSECGVSRVEREAVGRGGEVYTWTFILVAEVTRGRISRMCQFDADAEGAAFAYAEERVRAKRSRLAVANRAAETVNELVRAIVAGDADHAIACYADSFAYDDCRSISGDPINGSVAMRAALGRLLEQYNHFEANAFAVRGERLHLGFGRFSNDSGYETTYLIVHEVVDGRISYEGRFDEDDFEGAYRELERRYYAGEGAAFTEMGTIGTEFVIALNTLDFKRMSDTVSETDFRIENRSSSPLAHRSFAEFRASLEELDAMVESARTWNSALRIVSPNCAVARQEREAVGHDGAQYVWSRLVVSEFRDGQFTVACEFDLEDEEAAFAYAEERMRASKGRLSLSNRASQTSRALVAALNDNDLDGATKCFSDRFVFADQRRLGGNPLDDIRTALGRILEQYSYFEGRTLAVRGDTLHLLKGRWSDDSGNETSYLHVQEVDDNGLMIREARFDEDDFESAYRELNRRYYAGEGAAYAAAGEIVTEYVIALHRGDLDRAVGELSAPDFRLENRSRSVFGDRTGAEFRAAQEELNMMVTSVRTFNSVMRWLSPTVAVSRFEREALGHDHERYAWNFIIVSEIHDGRVAKVRQFDLEDETAAFEYADERARADVSRLAAENRASETCRQFVAALNANDPEGAVEFFSKHWEFDDQRRLAGNPLSDAHAAVSGIMAQYHTFELQTLAVRGERLHLCWSRWSDDSGNQTCHLHVQEVDCDGRFAYEGRFDEDDFESAYSELERRYYTGDGTAYADLLIGGTDWLNTLNKGEIDRVFDELATPDFYVQTRSSSVFGNRSATEVRASLTDLQDMVAWVRTWNVAEHPLSPTWGVVRQQRDAVGREGEQYTWTWIYVCEFRGRQIASLCQFDVEDEAAAFEYAEERIRTRDSRLPITNLAKQTWDKVGRILIAHDADAMAECYAQDFEFDDRRWLRGSPPNDIRDAVELILEQYTQFEGRSLAVRGEHLHLGSGRWSNDSGFETSYFFVHEVDDDGRIVYEGRFDEDNFALANLEFEQRYYAGEGAAFAGSAVATTESIFAFNTGDLDRMFELASPEMRYEVQSRSVIPSRSKAEMRAGLEDLCTWVSSLRSWFAAVQWLSPSCCVARNEREAVGHDGENYSWTKLYVVEIRDGRGVSSCEFELDDEDAAFAYAEEVARAGSTRLSTTNRASRAGETVQQALRQRNAASAATCYSASFEYSDQRSLGGNPPMDMRSATERVLEQYTHFQGRTLAVRGENLALGWTRWSDDAGFETTYLSVHEVGGDGLINYASRFDEDDFNAAYREFTRRFAAGEGADVADAVVAGAEYLIAINEGNFDLFQQLICPDFRVENRTRTGLPDRSADELRTSYEELRAMVGPSLSWNSAECWLSPSVGVVRHERETFGRDGEQYAWTKVMVSEWHDGRCTHLCLFEPDEEAAAFAYAEERVRAIPRRLAVTNRAKRTMDAIDRASQAGDFASAAAFYPPSLVYEDRRRLSGDPVGNMRTAIERIAEQYVQYEFRTLAVRGDHLHLGWTRWVSESGFESSSLWVHEVGEDGQMVYQCRFDEDDFNAAYRELTRRYCAGEGAAFAEGVIPGAEWLINLNNRELDRVFGELTDPAARIENRSSSAFPDRSARDLRTSFEDLYEMVTSARSWNSAECWLNATCAVIRHERQAIGKDGEQYAWTKLYVLEIRDGRITGWCEFAVEDEAAAFAYAEKRIRSG
ncbi:nuclear transport factor 2 family protein [Mycobacterium sp. NPDC051804]|uniref:nuclear transport factor 2 family protein n=1 Tax=Mycobacterium sp. NPDC051804 TaxID=3364295 RepID=UPI0037B0DBE9